MREGAAESSDLFLNFFVNKYAKSLYCICKSRTEHQYDSFLHKHSPPNAEKQYHTYKAEECIWPVIYYEEVTERKRNILPSRMQFYHPEL